MSKDYYNILGVNKTANQDEIKKAFRKKAHEFHPDKKHGDEARFKEVNEAYQVLGDQKKRSQYDQFGSTFEQAQAGGGYSGFDGFRDFSGYANGFSEGGTKVDMDDLGEIFEGIGDIFGFGGGRRRTRAQRGNDIHVILTIEFSEAVFGIDKELNLKKKVKCDRCKGNCAEPGSKIEICKTCGGSGQQARVQRTILGNIQMQTTCTDCAGEGKAYDKKCIKCSGTGVCEELTTLKVKIPAGINNGEIIRLTGEGEAGPKGASAGDLYLKIRVNLDKRFERDGYDIKTKAEISFSQAALGDKIDIESVDGPIKLKIPAGTQSGTIFKLRNRGVTQLSGHAPFGSAQGRRGDQLVEVIVKTPTRLTKKQKDLLEEIDRS